MKMLKGALVLLLILTTACSNTEETEKQEEKVMNETSVTVEPYALSDKEQLLVSKTGIDYSEFFLLNGKVANTENIIYELVEFKNGGNEKVIMSSQGNPEEYKDELLSFVTNTLPTNNQMEMILGTPGGSSGTDVSPIMSSWTSGKLLEDKVKLAKEKPLYIAGWAGTSKNSLRGLSSAANGELPQGVKEAEVAYLYRLRLVDSNK
ncbi:hypothetical protein LC040_18805 [Bacillus tianshenii]|nr:hypothetical protein LC040_18805 [Bacillus tianshenii]